MQVFTTLKVVWALAICRPIFPAGEMSFTNEMKKGSRIRAMILPHRLNITWEQATRLAFRPLCRVAMTAVIQVPILSPKITGIAPSRGINPWLAMAIRIPMVAEEDWITRVIPNPVSSPRIGWVENLPRISTIRGSCRSGITALLIILMPSIRIPKPKSTEPRFFKVRFRHKICITKPMAMIRVI